MLRIVDNPNNFSEEFRRMSGTTMLSAVYGYEVTSAHDPLVKAVELAVNHICEAAVPGNFYVNTIPWLQYAPDWFPGTHWKQKVKQWRAALVEMVDTPFNWAENQISQGTPAPSVVKTLLAELENQTMTSADHEEEIDMIKWTAGTLFAAGADTTVAAILIFVLAMTLYPDVQAKAQAEIDRVVGKDRLPEIEDRDSMPYLECVLKEVLRWQSVTPLGPPIIMTSKTKPSAQSRLLSSNAPAAKTTRPKTPANSPANPAVPDATPTCCNEAVAFLSALGFMLENDTIDRGLITSVLTSVAKMSGLSGQASNAIYAIIQLLPKALDLGLQLEAMASAISEISKRPRRPNRLQKSRN
ncbi:cytochrome P450 family protein [Ceratobasidium sp. AG-Ba]|nr:cytochrome P450 family protein [Ceratobasidium sp. AG-Ba]